MNGRLLKHVRILLGLNQMEFGDLLGVKQASISKFENGRAKPSRTFVNRLGVVLKQSGLGQSELFKISEILVEKSRGEEQDGQNN